MQTKSTSVSREKRANGEGSVYPKILKSGKKRYIAAAKDINGKMRRVSFNKKSDAYDHLFQMKRFSLR